MPESKTDLLEAAKDTLRILEAVRFTAGLGKNQLARMEAVRAAVATEEARRKEVAAVLPDLRLAMTCLRCNRGNEAENLIAASIARLEGRSVAQSPALNTEAERLKRLEDMTRLMAGEGKDHG